MESVNTPGLPRVSSRSKNKTVTLCKVMRGKNALSTVMCEVSSLIVSFPSPNLAMSLTFSPSGGERFEKKKKPLEMTLMIFQQKSLLKISLHKREIFGGARRSRSS